MKRAVEGLGIAPQRALANSNRCPALACVAKAVVRGDGSVPAIGAASIPAKVSPDLEMLVMV
jgi:ribonuclease HII